MSCSPKLSYPLVLPLLALAALAAVDSRNAEADKPEQSLSETPAVRRFRQAQPGTRFLNIDGRTTRVFGASFGSGATPEQTAERFRHQHAGIFGVEPQDLDARGPLADGRHTQPLVFDPGSGTYKFTLVYFTQTRGGIPVFMSDLRLLVRNEQDYPLVLAASGLRDIGGFQPDLVAPRDPTQGRAGALAAYPTLVNFTKPQLVIWAGAGESVAPPHLAFRFIADDGLPAGQVGIKRLLVTEAATGAILYDENKLLDVDVAGNVSAMASEGPGADICAEEALQPMAYARATIGATQAFANIDGDFVIPNAGASAVSVQSQVRGQYFVVTNLGSPNSQLSAMVTPPGPADFVHNQANAAEFYRGEVNAYISANVVRDFTLAHNPAYPVIGGQTEFGITVNESGGFLCPGNAQYQGDNLRFCAAGDGYPNTAWTSVVFHEYGHHLVDVGGSGQGAYGEGMGDVMSVLILDDPRLGLGFFGDCDSSLRHADNSIQYPCNDEIHICGQLISGCVWETRNELIITEPDDYMDILAPVAINAIMLHNGSDINPGISVDYLTLDDDDPNINNGTPHAAEICTGFAEHNMDCPLADIAFDYPDGRPDQVIPGQVTTFPVAVVGIIEAPLPGSGTISYRIGPSGPFTTQSMTSLGLNTYQAALPAALCGERVEFYVSADAAGGETVSDPVTAPADVYEALAAHSLDTLAAYDFETNPGWAVTDSGGLTDGTWDRGVPAGGGDRGDPPTDYDGSGQCWLTDNVDGNSDVDGGTTTLTTQNFDLSAAEDPYVTYARWYSNTFGDAPMADIFEVEISNNGGSSWQDLETIGPTGPEVDGGWFVVNYRIADFITPTAQTRLRFKASDLGSPSVVEAGVDAFSIYDIVCEPCTEPCDDGNPCTLNDACVATTCVGTPVNCSAFSTQCALASCNPAGSSGNCSLLIPMANGTPCDDDDNCNNGEACQGGTCAGGSSPDCSAESDECNTASCDPAGGEGNCDLLSPDNEGQLCSAGTGMCVLGACLDLCAQAADCADLDQDGVRDDGCVWWACVGGACHPQAIGFADMGGSFGTCPPDGTADSSDRFHALNCFADTDTAGNAQAYPCEAAPPAAFNVDAGGQFGDCSPDGVCDGNDAFHALNAFAGATSCSCPADGPVPASPEHKAPTSTGRAELVLRAPRAVLGPNESLEVSVYLGSDLADLRGYQLHLGVSGGTSGSLQLIDVAVQARPDAAFDQLGAWQAFNVATAQMVAGLDSPGVKAPAGSYLATFTYRASPDAAGPFVIEVLHDAGNPAHRTFLFPTPAAAGIEISASNALVIPVDSAGSITRR